MNAHPFCDDGAGNCRACGGTHDDVDRMRNDH